MSILIIARDLASPAIGAIGKALGALGTTGMAAAAASTALAALGGIAVKQAADFDQVMHKISALTTTSASQMEYYKQKILELGPALDLSSVDMGKALYFIISAGFEGSKAIDVLTYSAKAATAGMANQANVADALTSILKSYEGENISVGRAVDDLTKMVVNGKVEFDTISRGIGFTAVQAHAAGLSIDEMSAAVARLTQVSGESGARRIRMEFDNLTRGIGIDVDGVAKRAVDLGLSFDKGKFAAMDFMSKLQYLAKITGGLKGDYNEATVAQWMKTAATMDDAQAEEYLAEQYAHSNSMLKHLVGGAAAFIPAMVLLTNHGKGYIDILKQMGTEGEATNKAFDIMRQSTNQQWKMFEMTLNSIAVTIGLHLLPYVNLFLGKLIELGRDAIAWLQHADNIRILKEIVLGLAGIIATVLGPAITGAVLAAAPFVFTFAAIVAVSIVLGKVIEALIAHWGSLENFLRDSSPLAIALKVALGMLAVYILTEVVTAFVLWAQSAWAAAAGMIAANLPVFALVAVIFLLVFAITMLVTHWKQVTDFLGATAGAIGSALGTFFGAAGRAIGGFFNGLGTWVSNALSTIGRFFSGVGTWVNHAVSAIGSAIGGAFNALKNAIGYILYSIFAFIVGAIVIAFRAIGSIPLVQDILHAIQAGFGMVVMIVQMALSTVANIFRTVWNAITFGVRVALGFLGNILRAALQGIVNVAKFVWGLLYNYLISPIWNGIQWIVNGLSNLNSFLSGWILEQLGRFGSWAAGIGQAIANGASNLNTFLKQSIIDPIVNGITGLVKSAWEWGSKLLGNFIDGIKQKWNDFTSMLGSIKDTGNQWLQGHSPPPKWPEQGMYGATLIRNLSTGITGNLPILHHAISQVQATVNPMMPQRATMMPALSPASATTTHNWNMAGAFPGVTSADEVQKAFESMMNQRERGNYRKARQPGGYQGQRSGI